MEESPCKVIGYYVTEKKNAKMNWAEFGNVCRLVVYIFLNSIFNVVVSLILLAVFKIMSLLFFVQFSIHYNVLCIN